MSLTAFVIILGFFLVSCGIKGPPLPPLDTIQKQKNIQTQNLNPSSSVVSADKTEAIQKKKDPR